VNAHLLQMQGKMFRPTLLLLADEATGDPDPRAATLAAVVELIHLATLVHDDSVDHSVLRRGMPTVNALFSHQVSVIMGDYLYSRAVIELVRLDDLEPLQILARVTNDDGRGDAPAAGARPARLLGGAVRPAHPGQDRIPPVRGL
jgi:octaprenyl-diphosphate synthase